MLKIGAHQSILGGYHNALISVNKIGGNCLQIFSTSPRSWSFAKIGPSEINEFKKIKQELNINPVYFHASYLVNLAGIERVGKLSKQLIKHEINLASQLGIKGTIVHLGSFKNTLPLLPIENHDQYGDLTIVIKEILQDTPKDTLFIIENAGNKKIGKDLKEIAIIIDQVNDDRVRVCLDTCHLYSADYDLSSPDKLNRFLDAFGSLIGLEKIELFHFNDSRDLLNSGRDRHENIGKGTIPIDEFKLIMNHPKLKHLPFIIETPGFDNKGPDKKNLDILKSLLD